jgi:mRNA surveillance protein pelota
MQLLNKSKLNYELRIETLDDLWVLSQFIVDSDKIYATTERKVKIGNDRTKQIKKLIFIELLVKKTSFENEVLRVSGEIQNETEFTTINQAHTLSFNINDKIKIEKQNLLKFEEEMLNNQLESKKSHNLLVLMDKDELIAVDFSDLTHSVLFEKKGLGSKKYIHNEINEEEEKFKILEEFLKRDYSNIILSGPGLWKDKLQKYIKEKNNLNCLVLSFPDVSNNAIPKVINEINSKGLIQDSQISRENEFISKLLENINKGSKYVYGEENTINSINEGRLDVFLISTKFIHTKKEEEKYTQINEVMKLVESLNGKLVIINSNNETGKVLDGLGGIGGILRY